MLHKQTAANAASVVDRIMSLEGPWWCVDRVAKLKTIAGRKRTVSSPVEGRTRGEVGYRLEDMEIAKGDSGRNRAQVT